MNQLLNSNQYLFYLLNKLNNWQQYYKILCELNITNLKQLQNHLTTKSIFKLNNKLFNLQLTNIEIDYQWQQQYNHYIITYDSYFYPQLLKHIYNPPAILYVIGNYKLLQHNLLAIVGSRKATTVGINIARNFSQELSKHLTIISGLAFGIDINCHTSCLQANWPTIAVMPAGLNHLTPKKHLTIAKKIIANNGALVSEIAPNIVPRPYHFPIRNRIISGLSLGTLIIEAELNSGSLITANHALEQGREVMAIPGSIDNSLATGCIELIQQGAACINSTNMILNELNIKKLARGFEPPTG